MYSSPSSSGSRGVKIVSWNICRGYNRAGLLAELQGIDADILLLQEVDVMCERTGNIDVGAYLAQELHLNYYFVCEFEELRSELRTAELQG